MLYGLKQIDLKNSLFSPGQPIKLLFYAENVTSGRLRKKHSNPSAVNTT